MYGSHYFRKTLLIIILLPLNYFLYSAVESESCFAQTKLVDIHEIPFTLERNKVIMQVTVGNSAPIKVILDTGMPIEGLLLYNKTLKDSLDLKNAVDVKVPGAGKGKPSTAVMADAMSFNAGNVQFDNQRIVILQNDQFKGFPTDGVIGHSLLGNYVVEIDYEDAKIRLFNREQIEVDESWQSLPITFKNNKKIPWVEASINTTGAEDVNIDVYIDLASGEGVELLTRDDQRFKLPDNLEDAYLGRGLSGDIYGQKGFIHRLTLGTYTLNHVDAAFAPAKVRSKQKGADGVIGNNLLRRFNVIFDYFNQKLYVKPSKYYGEPF